MIFGRAVLILSAVTLGFAQNPKFEAADVHLSAVKSGQIPPVRTTVRGGRMEIKNATMVDLIKSAYGFDADKILGGPSWLEMTRFDVAAKLPAEITPELQKSMLQTLLKERFSLAVHQDTKPLPAYVLAVGKKPQLKEASGTEEPGCKAESAGAVPGGMTIHMGDAVAAAQGVPATLHLGPGGTLEFHCRNMSMASFAKNLGGMMNVSLGTIVDDTGIKGNWNFDIHWSVLSVPGMESGHVTVFEAVDKQLGLKLESRQMPTPVLIVDSANEKPAPNPADTATLLPPIPAPTEFEVASVKLTDSPNRTSGLAMQPGGRVNGQAVPMRILLNYAFGQPPPDLLIDVPAWADTQRYEVTAKAPAADPAAPAMDIETLAPLVRALLTDRFQLKYHTEDRPIAAYALVAVKPKLKKADPASRSYCKFPGPPPGTPPGSRILACQNVTLAQFAERLQRLSQELLLPVEDRTALEGTWDLTLIFNPNAGVLLNRSGGDSAASDPSGAITLFEAMEKQLGLKLEKEKRPMQVFVIDHLEQKPKEN